MVEGDAPVSDGLPYSCCVFVLCAPRDALLGSGMFLRLLDRLVREWLVAVGEAPLSFGRLCESCMFLSCVFLATFSGCGMSL
jgi:hypothetical protein